MPCTTNIMQTQMKRRQRAAWLNDVLQVRASNHFGHQRIEHRRGQAASPDRQLHHAQLCRVSIASQHALAFRRIVFQQLQCPPRPGRRQNHHADDGSWAGACPSANGFFGMKESTICGTVRSATFTPRSWSELRSNARFQLYPEPDPRRSGRTGWSPAHPPAQQSAW